jgi:hypothetical protein
MPNPYSIIGSILLVLALCFGAYRHGYNQAVGVAAEEKLAQARATAATIAVYEAALVQAKDKLRDAERAYTEAQATASADYQKLKGERDAAVRKSLAAVATGDKRLYVHASCPAPTTSAAGGVPQASADPSGVADTSAVQLSPADGLFLESFAAEADDLADKYRRCQVELVNDRR